MRPPRIRSSIVTASLLAALAASTVTMTVPSIAHAAEPSAAEKANAQKLVADGDRLAGERDFKGALH